MNLFIRSLFFGIIAAFFALIIEQIIYMAGGATMEYELLPKLSIMLLAAAATEEVIKLVVISKNTENTTNTKKMILASAVLGLGFSAAEIFLYAFNETVFWQDSILPLAQIAVLHIVTAGIAGAVIIRRQKFPLIMAVLLIINFLIHVSYNFVLLSS